MNKVSRPSGKPRGLVTQETPEVNAAGRDNPLLPIKFSGKVIHGAGRGRTLGFPTANLDTILPSDLPLGIFAGWVHSPLSKRGAGGDFIHRPAVIYWGQQPTFDGTVTICEVFLINENEDLYSAEIHGELTSFIRPDQRFKFPTDLTAQMHQDVAEARRHLSLDS